MAVTDFLAAPDITKVPEGVDSLHRVWVLADTVAAPITPRNVTGVQNLTPTAITPQMTKQVFQQGSGEDNYFEKRSRFQHDLTVQLLSGDVEDFIADIKNVTLGTDYTLPMIAHSDPLICWEHVVRKPDGTHLWSEVYRNLILREWTMPSPMEDAVVDISFYSKYTPLMVYTGYELVVDRFDGDGSTTEFTLSSEPVQIADVSASREVVDLYYDEMIDIIYKTSAQDFGTLQRSGYSNSTTTVTATTAPAASSELTISYIAATA